MLIYVTDLENVHTTSSKSDWLIRQRNLSSQSDKIVLTNLSSTDPFNADPHTTHDQVMKI